LWDDVVFDDLEWHYKVILATVNLSRASVLTE